MLLIMSSTMNMFEQQVRQSMEETRDKSISGFKKRYEIIKESLIWVNKYASMLSASYLIKCDNCGTEDHHYNYQCECNPDTILAHYNIDDKCHVSMHVLEFVLFTGASEILSRMRNIDKECKTLVDIYGRVHPIYLCETLTNVYMHVHPIYYCFFLK